MEVALFSDQTPTGNLSVDNVDVQVTGDDITGGDGVRAESTQDGLRVVLGDFRCPSSGSFGSGDQQSAAATVVISFEASDANVGVGLEREVTVECVPD
ncbi:hypothetical protein G9464_13590 [Halostella sp. JP-L12]|uniref:hypothetical protein n=1 Tax=Halostella TaxID=1843185 RepID=UPI000EF78A68|nr:MULTISPECIES: hypothetical protein [Halostella]NHN48620.1 hypothetical protein [Halostella sp. JP-L12]